MALRLIEMILKDAEATKIFDALKKYSLLEYRQIQLPNNEIFVRILLNAEQSEPILDLLQKNNIGNEKNRLVIIPIEATLPRAPEPIVTTKQPERVSREELHEDIKDAARCSKIYIVMLVLSIVVATVGLHSNSVVTIIGAMVIAPMLGPSVAIGLGVILADFALVKRAIFTSLVGIFLTLILSFGIGTLIHVNPQLHEVALRTHVGMGNAVIALAAGCAGVFAFTAGVSAILIGVMVAVSLLPPLATSGLLLGDGHILLAADALSLFLLNFICVNLAAVATFLLQGVRPRSWQEKNKAAKASRVAIAVWIIMLAILAIIILLLKK
ncbi:MAG: TIGR00341 family protein [Coxiellaceae bacterium]|nr:TIGR00341 family protein [Coxiellaceae bacterium]